MMRGRGRGRGKGGSGMTRPQARDDDGKIITLPQQSEGPPPVYPPCELPSPLSEQQFADVEPIVRALHLMNSRYRNSPFHPEYISGNNIGTRRRKVLTQRNALMSVLTLHPENMPAELFTEKQKAMGGNRAAQAAYWASATSTKHRSGLHDIPIDLGKLEELEAQEIKGEGLPQWAGQTGIGSSIAVDVDEEMAREEAEAADEAEMEGMVDDDGLGDNDIDPYEVYDDDDDGGYNEDDGDGGEAWM